MGLIIPTTNGMGSLTVTIFFSWHEVVKRIIIALDPLSRYTFISRFVPEKIADVFSFVIPFHYFKIF